MNEYIGRTALFSSSTINLSIMIFEILIKKYTKLLQIPREMLHGFVLNVSIRVLE